MDSASSVLHVFVDGFQAERERDTRQRRGWGEEKKCLGLKEESCLVFLERDIELGWEKRRLITDIISKKTVRLSFITNC